MALPVMRYKTFTWPNNPTYYTIRQERVVAKHKIPFGGCVLQDLGTTCQVMEGEGVFTGPTAYEDFTRLNDLFLAGGPGVLVHPIWVSASAYLVKLTLKEEPRADYVAYTFTFWEEKGETAASRKDTEPAYYTVCPGDSLWGIAARYGTTVDALQALNPTLKNANLIQVGQTLRVTA